jgi:hypothetical protein
MKREEGNHSCARVFISVVPELAASLKQVIEQHMGLKDCDL